MQFADLEPHAHAQGGVKVRQRLVKEKGLGLAHDRAADGDALALPARQLAGLAVEIAREVEHLGRRLHAAVLLSAVHPRHAQRKRDVGAHRHVRIERIGLEHHRKPPPGRRRRRHVLPVDLDPARGHILEPGDEAQERGLAAARGADEDDEFAVLDGKVERRDDLGLPEPLGDARKGDLAHLSLSYFTAPKVRPRTSCFWLNQPMIRIGAMASVEAAESLA